MAYQQNKEYKPYPDNGSLRVTSSKKTAKSPDYWGNIAINLKDITGIETVDGLTVIKLSGWKKVGKDGKTFLSISVDRFVPEAKSGDYQNRSQGFSSEPADDDIPF